MVLRIHPTDYNIFTQQPTWSWWISNLPWLLHPPCRKVPGFHLDESALPTCLEGRRRMSAAAEMAVREEEPQGSLSLVLSQCKFKSQKEMMEICWIMIYSWLLTIWIFQESSKKVEHRTSTKCWQPNTTYCNIVTIIIPTCTNYRWTSTNVVQHCWCNAEPA